MCNFAKMEAALRERHPLHNAKSDQLAGGKMQWLMQLGEEVGCNGRPGAGAKIH